jgi:hypothetical protein
MSEWKCEGSGGGCSDLDSLFGCYFNIADWVGIINVISSDNETIRESEVIDTSVEYNTIGTCISDII